MSVHATQKAFGHGANLKEQLHTRGNGKGILYHKDVALAIHHREFIVKPQASGHIFVNASLAGIGLKAMISA